MLLPGGENGLGEDVPSKYFLNFFSDFPFLHEPFQPAAELARLFRRKMDRRTGSSSTPLALTIEESWMRWATPTARTCA